MQRATLLIAGLSTFLATAAQAVRFDLIVPKRLVINTARHTANILLARSWGMVIATDDAIGESNILDAEVSFTIDDPAVSNGQTEFINVPQATPIAKNTAAGGFGFSPDIDLLQPGETRPFTSPLYVLSMGGWPNEHQGTATLEARMKIGFHEAEYRTEVVFVFEPDDPFLIRREEAQRITAEAPGFLDDLTFDGGADLAIRFPPFPRPACDDPEPASFGCTTLCKPCKRYVCVEGEWIPIEVEPPEGLCRSRRSGTPYSKDKQDRPLVASPRTADNRCPTECDLCW
jgi:hypothetical protein